jgi:YD repeat-containing protein
MANGTSISGTASETVVYDNAGRITKIYRTKESGGSGPVATASGDVSVFEYDSVGRLKRRSVESEPLGIPADPDSPPPSPTVLFEEKYTYNLAGELTSFTDGRGNITSATYNSRGLLATTTLPDPDGSGSQFGLVITNSYDNMGRLVSEDRGFGRVTSYEYNSRNWITKITQPDPDGAGPLAAPITTFVYNVRGDRTTVTDPLGRVTTKAYDDEQRPTAATFPDPDGSGPLTSPVITTSYNAMGWVTSTTDPMGAVTSFSYDNLGRLLTRTDPDPDGAGPLAAPVTTHVYNDSGLWKVTDALNKTTTFARDSKGRISSVTDHAGNVTDFEYDFYGNLTKKSDPDPDGSGPLTRPITQYTYDSVDRLLTKKDPLNGTTTYSYDKASNLTSLKDPVNNTTNFAYDGHNRLVLDTNSLSKSKTYTYDVAGNLTQTIDRMGRVIQYTYDSLDRQTSESWRVSTTVPTLTTSTTQQGGQVDEIQNVGWTTYSWFITGTFTISFDGQTTSALASNATAASIQSALESLSTVGTGNVLVTDTTVSGSQSRSFKLTFRNGKGGTNVVQATINTSNLDDFGFGGVTGFNTTQTTGGTFSETQSIVLANATGGTWRVAYDGEISAPLSTTITAAQLKTALDAFQGIHSVTVTGSSGNFTVTFGGTQANTNVSQIFGDAANATTGSATEPSRQPTMSQANSPKSATRVPQSD